MTMLDCEIRFRLLSIEPDGSSLRVVENCITSLRSRWTLTRNKCHHLWYDFCLWATWWHKWFTRLVQTNKTILCHCWWVSGLKLSSRRLGSNHCWDKTALIGDVDQSIYSAMDSIRKYTKCITCQPTIEAYQEILDIGNQWLPLTQKGGQVENPWRLREKLPASHQMVWNSRW